MDLASAHTVTIVIPAFLISAGIVFYTAVQATAVGIVRRRVPLYFAFALACLCAMVYQLATVAYYTGGSVASAAYALHWQLSAVFVFCPAFFAFTALYTDQQRIAPWLTVVAAFFALLALDNLAQPYGVRFSSLEADGTLRLPWGESLSHFSGAPSGWDAVFHLSGLALLIWAFARAVIQYRRGVRRAALFLAGYLILQTASLLNSWLIDLGVIRSLYLGGFAFLSLAVLMSLSLGLELQERTVELEATGTALRSTVGRLQLSDDRLRRALEAGNVGIWEWDMTTNEVTWSGGVEQMFGLTPGSFQGTFDAYRALVYPEDRLMLDHQLQLTLKQEGPFAVEYRITRPDGALRWLLGQGRLVRGPEGKPLRMLGTVLDITDLKRAEEALLESGKHLRQQSDVLVRLSKSTALERGDLKTALKEITQAAADTLAIERVDVWIYNEDRSMIHCIEMYERSTDAHSDGQALKAEEYPAYFKGLEEGRTIAADDAFSDPRTREFSENYLSVHDISSMLDAPIRIAGRVAGVICHEHIGPPRHWTVEEQNFAGSMADVVALAIDSHERRRAEAALRESEERFRRLSEGPFEGIAITEEGRILDANEQMGNILGYRQTELIGMSVSQLVAPESRELVMGKIRSADETPYEHLALRKDGSIFPVEVYGRRIPYKGRMVRITALRDITERKRVEASLRRAAEEIERLKNRIEAEKIYLQDEIKVEHNFEEIIGVSPNFIAILHQVEQVASTDSTVLILGETGTGKELIARAIHNISPRAHRTLVKVNCAALPEHLIESELFGHEKGAFTGALSRTIGRFELADGGTLFLDEIGELPLGLQVKLLRVLQEGEFERVGSARTHRVDVRVIAATNRNLTDAVDHGTFRSDLYFRLNVFPITVPPLRERRQDIPLLVKHFVAKFSGRIGKEIDQISKQSMDRLSAYHWPGNIRELENVIERAVILNHGPILDIGDQLELQPPDPTRSDRASTLREQEQSVIRQALEECRWTIEGSHGAAARLDIPPSTLRDRMRKYGIEKSREIS
jgi:PAS domain S-box-containing protein